MKDWQFWAAMALACLLAGSDSTVITLGLIFAIIGLLSLLPKSKEK